MICLIFLSFYFKQGSTLQWNCRDLKGWAGGRGYVRQKCLCCGDNVHTDKRVRTGLSISHVWKTMFNKKKYCIFDIYLHTSNEDAVAVAR